MAHSFRFCRQATDIVGVSGHGPDADREFLNCGGDGRRSSALLLDSLCQARGVSEHHFAFLNDGISTFSRFGDELTDPALHCVHRGDDAALVSGHDMQRFGQVALRDAAEGRCRLRRLSTDLAKNASAGENDDSGNDQNTGDPQCDSQCTSAFEPGFQRVPVRTGCRFRNFSDLEQIVANFPPGGCFLIDQQRLCFSAVTALDQCDNLLLQRLPLLYVAL